MSSVPVGSFVRVVSATVSILVRLLARPMRPSAVTKSTDERFSENISRNGDKTRHYRRSEVITLKSS